MFVVSIVKIADAQEYMYQRGLVTLSAGVAVPAYDFGKFQGIELSSYADYGTNITAEATYFYSWHVGVSFMLNYSVNPIHKEKLEDAYLRSSPAFKTVSAETEPFRDLSGLVGFVFDIPPNKYFSFTFKMMGGLRNIYKPTVLIKTTTVFSSVDYYETSDSEYVFAFLTSAGLRVIVSNHVNLHLNASYIGSRFAFEYKRNRTEISQAAHVGVVSMAAGASYSF